MISPIEKALLGIMIIIIMFGMGATLTTDNFKTALKRPKGILIGFTSQFGFMPLLAFALARFLNLPPEQAISLILIGCLPAGTTSNMFSYFSRGDVALSISMTVASTLGCIIMMPLLLSFYAEPFVMELNQAYAMSNEDPFVIPTKNIVTSLIAVLVPVCLGMVLKRFHAGWAKAAEDTAGFMGIIVILFLIASWVPRNFGALLTTSWNVYVSAVLIGFTGFLFGYAFSRLWRLHPRLSRTVSLETGIQNGPLSFAIIILSFQEPLQSQILWIPLLYSVFIVILSSLVTLHYRKIGAEDWAHYENSLIQERLFKKVFE